jgi:hypothetical protein
MSGCRLARASPIMEICGSVFLANPASGRLADARSWYEFGNLNPCLLLSLVFSRDMAFEITGLDRAVAVQW